MPEDYEVYTCWDCPRGCQAIMTISIWKRLYEYLNNSESNYSTGFFISLMLKCHGQGKFWMHERQTLPSANARKKCYRVITWSEIRQFLEHGGRKELECEY